jgi:hypothetical protein
MTLAKIAAVWRILVVVMGGEVVGLTVPRYPQLS